MSIVTVLVSSSISSLCSEKRFDKSTKILQLKGKLELITGTSPSSAVLELFNKENDKVCVLDQDDLMLGAYPVEDFFRIHVIDTSSRIGEFEDTSKVQKFELSTDEYHARSDSVKAFKERNKLGRFGEDFADKQALRDCEGQEEASRIHVGDRCEVRVKNNIPRRGRVMYVGKVDFKPGFWVGVMYDEPLGKNDGSVNGRSYFTCQSNYGGFAKARDVHVGDYPEEDIFDDDDEM